MSKRSDKIQAVRSRWLSSREAAKLLDVSHTLAARMAREGVFGQCRTFGRRRIPRAGVEKVAKEQGR